MKVVNKNENGHFDIEFRVIINGKEIKGIVEIKDEMLMKEDIVIERDTINKIISLFKDFKNELLSLRRFY